MDQKPGPLSPGAPFKRRSLVEQELVNSLDWLISLRWLAGAAVLGAAGLRAPPWGCRSRQDRSRPSGVGILALQRGPVVGAGLAAPGATRATRRRSRPSRASRSASTGWP